jgi:hypothetical protein
MRKKYTKFEELLPSEQIAILAEESRILQRKIRRKDDYHDKDDIYFGTTQLRQRLLSRKIWVSAPQIRTFLDDLIAKGKGRSIGFYDTKESVGYRRLYHLFYLTEI